MEEKGASGLATGGQIARGAAWMMGFKLLDRSVGLISTIVLARLLTPKDFGLVAMAIAVMAVLELMAAFGFDSALIQRQDAKREHYDTAWTFNVLFGIAIALLLVALASPAATFYHEPRLRLILVALAVSALVGGLENIGTVAFRKELDFRSEFRFLLAKRLVTFVVTVTLAVVLRTYWALIAGVVTGRFASVLISYRLHPYRPRFSLAACADLLHFSKWLFFSNLIQTLQSRSTDLILGRTVGPHALGIYSIAVEIAVMPSTEFVAPINRAVYPAYSRLAGDLDALVKRFMSVFALIGLIAFPVAVGVSCVANSAVNVLLGPQWQEAVPIIRITAICGLCGALQSNLYVVILALGRPKVNTLLAGALFTVSLPVLVVASVYHGVTGAAAAYLFAGLLGLCGIVAVFCRLSNVRVAVLVGSVWRPAVASACMAGIVIHLESWSGAGGTNLAGLPVLGLLVAAGAVTYAAIVAALWILAGFPAGPERSLLAAAGRTLAGWRTTRSS